MTDERASAAPGGNESPGAAAFPGNAGAMLEQLLGGARQHLSAEAIEGVAGGGAVRVQMDGEQNVLGVSLAPEVVDPGDIELLEELIVSALADAARQARAAKLRSVGALAEMFGLGGAFGGGPVEDD